MNYFISFSTKFKKDLKKYLKSPKDKEKVFATIELLSVGGYKNIPTYMRPHKLSGNYQNYWECHIKPDLLLIWKQEEKPEKFIILTRLGSHSDLF